MISVERKDMDRKRLQNIYGYEPEEVASIVASYLRVYECLRVGDKTSEEYQRSMEILEKVPYFITDSINKKVPELALPIFEEICK